MFSKKFFFVLIFVASPLALSLPASAACLNPSPVPTGYAAPCPVFSLSSASISQSGSLTLSATPQAGTDYIYTTAYIYDGASWKPYTLNGNNAYTGYSTALATLNLSSSQLTALPIGLRYAVVWDWFWDATAQCYKGPGLNQCNTGTWRVQVFNLTSGTYAYAQSSYYAYSQSGYGAYTYSQAAYNGSCVPDTQTPPRWYCARTDLLAAPTPTAPNVGNLTGAGTCFTDPDFGMKVCRLTDSANAGSSGTLTVGQGGSGDTNPWNLNSTKLIIGNTGGNECFFNFTPSTMAVSKMYGGWCLPDSFTWSQTNKDIVYGIGPNAATYGGEYRKWDTSSLTIPTPSTAANFLTGSGSLPSNGGCLGASFDVTWNTDGGVSEDGTIFGAGFSNNGGQGGPGALYVAAITPSGCQVLNTSNGVITSSGTLPSGTVPSWTTVMDPDGFTLHNVKMAKDGSYLIITPTGLVGTQSIVFWQVGTTNVVRVSNQADGHATQGYSHWFNSGFGGQWRSRLFSTPGTITNLIPSSLLPAGVVSVFDKHCGYYNADPSDTYPFFCSTYTTNNPIPNVAWYNEIIGVFPPTGKVARFAHTFATVKDNRFNTNYAIGAMSQDGRFFAWSSDWMGTLGSESGGTTCMLNGGKWLASTAYALNDKVNENGFTPSAVSDNFKVTTPGTSGATVPAWSTVPVGGTVTDGTVVWTNIHNDICRGDVFVVALK